MIALRTCGARMHFQRDSYRTETTTPVATMATVPAARGDEPYREFHHRSPSPRGADQHIEPVRTSCGAPSASRAHQGRRSGAPDASEGSGFGVQGSGFGVRTKTSVLCAALVPRCAGDHGLAVPAVADRVFQGQSFDRGKTR